jgi:glycerophosphoryl diester phosphodiesterase
MNLVRVILAVCICCSGFAQPAPEVDFSSCNFRAIGHRGYSSVYPENTLLALEEAFKRGIKICEIDVRVTTDDVYILFHDSEALHRTSNGKGAAEDFSYAQLRSLEVGSWKGEHFAGLSIPTLEDALLLAQQYDAQLYLDTKTLRPDLMLSALQTTGVDEHRLMPSLNDSTDIADFTSLLPSTPWVWFKGGSLPDAVDSIEFYQALVNQNCVAFEVSSSRVENEEWLNFEENVHLAGAKTWVFTENNNEINLLLSTKGVDAIESDRAWEILDYVCNGNERNFPDSLTRGNWRFTNGLDNVMGQGSQLRLADYRDPNPFSKPLFGRCEQFSIADLELGSDSVMYVPKQDVDGGLFVYTNAVVEDYGIEDQHYTIVMDVLFPESSLGNWIGLVQTNTSNINDAELFINPQNQIGVSEQYFGDIQPNTWYRIAVTVNISSGFMKLYIDGVLQGEIEIETNRWAVINSSASGEKQGFLLFSDDDEETQAAFLASLQFRDYELDAATIANLGGVKAEGIPSGNADLWKVDLPGHAIVRQLLDYDNFQHHVWVGSTEIGETELVFTQSKNAVTVPVSGSVLDWSTGAQKVLVTSDDGSITKAWQIILHESAVAVNDQKPEELSMFPNPSEGVVRLLSKRENMLAVSVFNSMGVRCFASYDIRAKELLIDLKNLPSGCYQVNVQTTKGIYNKSLVKF